jgi:arginine decarboxylase
MPNLVPPEVSTPSSATPEAARSATGGHPAAPPAPYRAAVESAWPGSRIWDYLRYDGDGCLWLNDLRVVDAVRRYGTPLEIVDTTLIERRCDAWKSLTQAVAREVGYPGWLDYVYAAKANMAAEVTHAAYRSGWNAETSTQQDLHHLVWLRRHGLVRPGLRVVCNGFKLPPDRLGLPADPGPALPTDLASAVDLPAFDRGHARHDTPYAEMIAHLAREGWDITPILDVGELDYFAAPGMPELNVGLRLKFGHVADADAQAAWVSRFGFDRAGLFAAADALAGVDHLQLTTLHAMVGAAETTPEQTLVDDLLYAGRVWAELRQRHSSLRELNMGGGLPPLGDPYDHRAFLTGLMTGLKAVCQDAGVPPPNLTFEFGSLVAAEAGFHVFRELQYKQNHTAAAGEPALWALLDGGLMAAIPDMLLIDKSFRFLAVEHAGMPARLVRFGDLTCDSDGRYPPKSFGPSAGVWMPATDAPMHVLIQGVGAYQEVLAGVRGAHHCGLLEAIELILEHGPTGRVRGRLLHRQTYREAAALLGYQDDVVHALEGALRWREASAGRAPAPAGPD